MNTVNLEVTVEDLKHFMDDCTRRIWTLEDKLDNEELGPCEHRNNLQTQLTCAKLLQDRLARLFVQANLKPEIATKVKTNTHD